MHLDEITRQLTSDLQVLSAATQGQPDPRAGIVLTEAEKLRIARVEELKAQYQAGTLSVDAIALAEKLVDEHLRE